MLEKEEVLHIYRAPAFDRHASQFSSPLLSIQGVHILLSYPVAYSMGEMHGSHKNEM